MYGAGPRRVWRAGAGRAVGFVVACAMAVVLAGCHGGAAAPSGSPGGTVDVKGACVALAGLKRSGAVLDGVDVADPSTSEAALATAIRQYSAALAAFEQVGPADLRADAAEVRAAVVARHFRQAVVARAAIDAWAAPHCS